MLIRFIVENFLSFKTQQTFSMVAGKNSNHFEQTIKINNKKILKGSFIFGANASGKSNFIKAVENAKLIIIRDLNKTYVERKYFRLDSEYKKKPSIFQFDIYAGNHFYSYGLVFSCTECKIISEWLYLIENESEICIFDRSTSNGKTIINSDLSLNKDNKYRLKIYGEDIPNTKTFLKEIAEKEIINSIQFSAFKDVWQWFHDLVVIFPNTHMSFDGISLFTSDQDNNLMQTLDTGIKSYATKEGPIDKMLSHFPDGLRNKITSDVTQILNEKNQSSFSAIIADEYYLFKKKNNKITVMQQMMDHGNPNELFSFTEESDGTKRLFDLLPFIANIEGSGVILIDELDRSFHTNLVIKYIKLFFENTKNLNIQLIASLHDVNIMNFEILRQDAIWFIYRDQKEGHSNIYSLNKFNIESKKTLIQDYLLGRFGSIPCFTQTTARDNEQ